MAWAEVSGSKASYYNAATATTAAVTLGAAVASGDLLWCAVSYSRATVGYVSSIATTGVTSGSWTLRGLENVLPGDDQVLGLWAAVATSAGTPTITVTFVATRTERSLYAGAFTGNDASGTADGGTGEYDATTNHPSVTFSTATDGDLLIGVSINNNQASAVAGSGFSTVATNGGLYPIAFEWKEQTTASGSTVVDFTSVSGTPGFVIIGAAFEPAAAVGTTLYFLDAAASGSNFGQLQVGGSAPSTATTATGWTVDTVGATNYALMAYASERASTTFSGTAQPAGNPDNSLGDCFRSTSTMSGDFATGVWTIAVPVIAVSAAAGQDGRVRVRLWKSANATGTSPTEITSGAVAGTTVTNLTTGAEQVSTVTTGSITGFSMANEYLFVQIAWEITGAAT